MKELDILFEKWEKRHLENGYERFIRDGIVNEKWWMQEQSVPKICFFLKEARTEKKEGYDLVKDLNECEPWKLWQKVAVWTQAIQLAFVGERSYDDSEIRLKSHEAVRQIAVVNVKKSNGLPESTEDDLWHYARTDRDLLKKELEIINKYLFISNMSAEQFREYYRAVMEKCEEINEIFIHEDGINVAVVYPKIMFVFHNLESCYLLKSYLEKIEDEEELAKNELTYQSTDHIVMTLDISAPLL